MTRADIADVELDGRKFRSVILSESGDYLVPKSLLDGESLFVSALDVVDITPAPVPGYYRLTARGNVAGTELLSSTIRLDIRPKISIGALQVLLRWSTHPITSMRAQELPVSAEEDHSVFDVFADRFAR